MCPKDTDSERKPARWQKKDETRESRGKLERREREEDPGTTRTTATSSPVHQEVKKLSY